jgi:hypothetical protein
MAEHRDVHTMFERLMTLNREAFDAGHYNTAYHTLAEEQDNPRQSRLCWLIQKHAEKWPGIRRFKTRKKDVPLQVKSQE